MVSVKTCTKLFSRLFHESSEAYHLAYTLKGLEVNVLRQLFVQSVTLYKLHRDHHNKVNRYHQHIWISPAPKHENERKTSLSDRDSTFQIQMIEYLSSPYIFFADIYELIGFTKNPLLG